MDSPAYSDRGLNPQTSDHGGNGKVVHYYGATSPHKGGGGYLHPTAEATLLCLRLLTCGLSLASILLLLTSNTSPNKARQQLQAKWVDFDAYRYVLAASAIVCIYSLAEILLGLWYVCKGRMLIPDSLAHWFDFGHDQGFAYLIFSACSAGTAVAHNLRERHMLIHGIYGCDEVSSFCTKMEISIGLAYGAFLFLALSSLLSGYRLARWLILGP